MTKSKVTILGINGHIGHYAAKAFAEAGWQVTGFGRTNKQPIEGVTFVAGDADSVEAMRAAIGDSEIVVNALNLPYHLWDQGRAEAQVEKVIAAMGTSGKTLLFPGNVYNYSAADRVMTPDLAQRPQTPRGEIRVRVEKLLKSASLRNHMQVIILRAGDFYGPNNKGDWFDQGILREAAKGKVAMLGGKGTGHAWAFLPDLGRAFEKLAWHRAELGAFENFHFAGHFATPEEMAAAITAAVPVPLKVSRFPWIILSIMGLASPVMREVAKMGYLWQHPMELKDERLDAILGPDFPTPFNDAVAATIAPFFAAERKAA